MTHPALPFRSARKHRGRKSSKKFMFHKYTIHTDGGSRGNPGPAAIGVVIKESLHGHHVEHGAHVGWEYGEYIGVTTNNEAEYQAVIFALKKLKHLIGNEKAEKAHVTFYMDSELLMKQLNHEYKVKEENIQKLFLEVHNLRLDFGKVEFKHVLRGKNTKADELVNQVLDRESNKLNL
jgi:ribonuclease HI